MNAKKRFTALEMICRERAEIIGEDKQYWLDEADEWARFAQSVDLVVDSPPLQLDILERDYRMSTRPPATGT
jgi:hypothetical protein